ncbi:MAG TPA: AAA family ATPase [Mycobacteriales bacterium]|nr:AAA family ATPase [Mycobacteriales bacterium]
MAPAPVAVLVSGPPAAGKSTLGAGVAAALGAALLDLDVLTGPLTAVVARLLRTDDLDGLVLAEATRTARYETIVAGAVDCLRCGTSAVLVAPFSAERADARRWAALAARLTAAGGRPQLVWLALPPDELLSRLRARGADRDAAKLADPAGFLSRTAAVPAIPHLQVDATWPLRRQTDFVVAAIG